MSKSTTKNVQSQNDQKAPKEYDLKSLESHIDTLRTAQIDGFIPFAHALYNVYKKDLWKAKWKDFNKFSSEVLDMTEKKAFAYIQAAWAVIQIKYGAKHKPHVTDIDMLIGSPVSQWDNLPRTFEQANLLAPYPASVQIELWEMARNFAGGKLTQAKHIRKAIKTKFPKEEDEQEPEQQQIVYTPSELLGRAKNFLQGQEANEELLPASKFLGRFIESLGTEVDIEGMVKEAYARVKGAERAAKTILSFPSQPGPVAAS